jgi:Receptor L domain
MANAERIARDTTEGFQMFSTMRSTFQLTTVLVALAANACAAPGVRPVESAVAKVSCVGGVVQTAADVALYGACERVNGDLRISAPELSDLSALAGLRSVSGKLEIAGNSALDDLSGLERLEQVGSLSIHDNAELDDLSGLQNLRAAKDVAISGNAELASLHGLEGLTRVDALVIEHNGLYQTTGLSNLSEVGSLIVTDNAKLNSLQGLRSLSHARSVQIRNNPRLCARGMLPALARVDHQLSVSDNRGLSRPDVHQLLGRIEHDLARPSTDNVARMEASLH